MKDVRTWWIDTGWPWVKAHWWVILLLPFMLLVALAMLLQKNTFRVVAPLEEADRRASEENARRASELAEENARLVRQLTALQEEYDGLQKHMEDRLDARIQDLREDPEKLRQVMLEAGRRR